jgi:hypothetical protein
MFSISRKSKKIKFVHSLIFLLIKNFGVFKFVHSLCFSLRKFYYKTKMNTFQMCSKFFWKFSKIWDVNLDTSGDHSAGHFWFGPLWRTPNWTKIFLWTQLKHLVIFFSVNLDATSTTKTKNSRDKRHSIFRWKCP